MTEYQVHLSVTHVYIVDVEAENEDAARDAATELWYAGEVEWTGPNDTYLVDAQIRRPLT